MPPPPARLNLNLLRAFAAVARHRSFTAAAAELGRTHATLSAQVRELELQADMRLLDRTTRRVTPTEAGAALLSATESALEGIARGLDEARRLAGDRERRILVACVPSLSGMRFPDILASYRLRDAATRIDVEELTSREIAEALAAGRVDIGLGPCAAPPPAGIGFTVAGEEPLCILLPRRAAPGAAGRMTLADLAELPLITLSGSVLLQTQLDRMMRDHGLELSSQTEVRHVQTAAGMVRAGIGAAIVPRLALPDRLEDDIAAVTLADAPLSRTLGVMIRRGDRLPPAAARFARHVRTEIGKALRRVTALDA